ncbi:MAG: MFS transporter [Rhodospirillales bacterium]|nr:MFS transporter [Rhodospirillales bacterium]
MDFFRQLRRRLFAFQIFLLLAGSCAVALSVSRTFEADLQPDMTRKGDLIASSLVGQFERALDYGVEFAKLRGVEDLFSTIRGSNTEILFVAAVDSQRHHTFYQGKPPQAHVIKTLDEAFDVDRSQNIETNRGNVERYGEYLVVSRPIILDNKEYGLVLVGMDAHYIQQQFTEIFYDIVVVLIVSLLLTFELLLLIMANASAPMLALQAVFLDPGRRDVARGVGQRLPGEVERLAHTLQTIVAWLDARYDGVCRTIEARSSNPIAQASLDEATAAFSALGHPQADQHQQSAMRQNQITVRMPLFVFFFAEELSRSFFPVFARSLAVPIDGLSTEVVVSLPMMLFMLIVAFSQPIGGPLSEKFGARRLMIAGALAAAAGLAFTAFATDFWELMASRFLTAAGYGVVFVAGQSHIVANSDASNRAWGLAMFVGAVLAASICGPAIGGILADRIGFRGTFIAGAVLAAISALLAARLLRDGRSGSAIRPLRVGDIGVVLANRRFVALVLFGAMPAKIVLTGFLYYLAPLFLAHLGNTPAETGRIMMLYGLMMVLLTPLSARLVDRLGRPLAFVVAGGVLSGAGLLAVVWSASTETMMMAVIMLGLAQAVSITPQLSLVPIACPQECKALGQVTVIGFFRLFERIGSALGPLLAAALLHRYGYETGIVVIGAGVAAGCVPLVCLWQMKRRCDTAEPIATAQPVRQAPTPKPPAGREDGTVSNGGIVNPVSSIR